ncbi:CHC2 zinc finger domain-containing protein [Clostridium sp. LP20]|uniref:CHC2 zinc finger domain-containing protein n=1 Tax=Clostridium sp. LP20 TaxID=3418665 RepID=UPI003EE5782C
MVLNRGGDKVKELQDIDLKQLIEDETGQRFNREGYINCPFHADKTPSLSVKFFPDANKERFKCWGCEEKGDSLDFIMKSKNCNIVEAKKYLGLSVEKTIKEKHIESIKEYIKWQMEKPLEQKGCKKGFELIGIYEFVGTNNKPLYYKAKFLKPNGKKTASYYSFKEDGKVTSLRPETEVPYNLHNVLQGINDNKVVVFVEGEKDANMINNTFRNNSYVATSIKGCKDLSIINDENIKVYVLGDTGEAGDRYKWKIHKEFFKNSIEFKFINLPGIKQLGDNKDVTDWIEAGHNKKDLLKAFSRSLDLKDNYELQQDSKGIYKTIVKNTEEGALERKIYLTDFTLKEAARLVFIDEEIEGVKLKLKSCTGDLIERTGPSTSFDDVRSFKNFLGTLDLSFKGRIDDLTELKGWINRYWAIENESIFSGTQFIAEDEGLALVTNEGAIKDNNIETNKKSDKSDFISICDIEEISKKELIELKKHIFKFASADKSISIIGTILNNLCVYQNISVKAFLHHLLIVGESGSGKSTILQNVVAAILNYPRKDIKSIGLITPFALIKELSTGNYPILFDEFKPSLLDRYKVQKISDTLRNSYDRSTVSRSDKSFTTTNFQLTRPIIIAGEESYPNREKALINRSAIVYLSKNERTIENTEAMKWIIANEGILNKFGRSLINEAISLSVEDYKDIREKIKDRYKNLKDRPLNTAVNIATGIEIFNILLKKHKIKELKNYEKYIIQNINEEILDGGEDTKSTVEQMISLYNEMIEDGRALDPKEVIKKQGSLLFIRTNEMINQIHMFVNQVGSAEIIPLKASDFKKQAKKSGYLVKLSSKNIKVSGVQTKFDEYNVKKMRALNVDAIIEPELVIVSSEEQKIIEGVF